jgi:hypothetical protein
MSVYGAASHGKPLRLQDLLPLPQRTSTHRTPETTDHGQGAQTLPQGWQAQNPQALFATPTAKQSVGYHLACTISTNTVLKAPVDQVQVTPCTIVCKHMAQTLSTASSPGGNCSTPFVLTVTTTPIGSTPATGKTSTFCVANTPGAIPHPLSAFMQTPVGAGFSLTDINRETSSCVDMSAIYVIPPHLSSSQLHSAATGGLCAPPCSFESPVTHTVESIRRGQMSRGIPPTVTVLIMPLVLKTKK